jgi:hypothetical protein
MRTERTFVNQKGATGLHELASVESADGWNIKKSINKAADTVKDTATATNKFVTNPTTSEYVGYQELASVGSSDTWNIKKSFNKVVDIAKDTAATTTKTVTKPETSEYLGYQELA